MKSVKSRLLSLFLVFAFCCNPHAMQADQPSPNPNVLQLVKTHSLDLVKAHPKELAIAGGGTLAATGTAAGLVFLWQNLPPAQAEMVKKALLSVYHQGTTFLYAIGVGIKNAVTNIENWKKAGKGAYKFASFVTEKSLKLLAFVIKNWKEILQLVLLIAVIVLMFIMYRKIQSKSEQVGEKIEEKQQQLEEWVDQQKKNLEEARKKWVDEPVKKVVETVIDTKEAIQTGVDVVTTLGAGLAELAKEDFKAAYNQVLELLAKGGELPTVAYEILQEAFRRGFLVPITYVKTAMNVIQDSFQFKDLFNTMQHYLTNPLGVIQSSDLFANLASQFKSIMDNAKVVPLLLKGFVSGDLSKVAMRVMQGQGAPFASKSLFQIIGEGVKMFLPGEKKALLPTSPKPQLKLMSYEEFGRKMAKEMKDKGASERITIQQMKMWYDQYKELEAKAHAKRLQVWRKKNATYLYEKAQGELELLQNKKLVLEPIPEEKSYISERANELRTMVWDVDPKELATHEYPHHVKKIETRNQKIKDEYKKELELLRDKVERLREQVESTSYSGWAFEQRAADTHF